jgi:hypothetical protein
VILRYSLFSIYTAQATMVRHMSEGQVARYKERVVADMRMNKRTHIRCPCRTCKLGSLLDPDSADLESHLLTHGFMSGYDSEDDEDVNNGISEDEGVHDDHHEGDGGGGHDDDHHEGDGGGGHDDDHHEGDGGDGHDDDGEDATSTGTQTRLTSVLQDPHVQELLLKETSNAKAAAREKAKLEQMEIDGKTPLYPGCRPEDTRLSVMLKALEMKAESKWTDVSFNKNMRFWQKGLPKGNTCPTNIEEAKKIVCLWTCRMLSTTSASMIAHFIRMSTRREPHARCAAKDDTR